MIEAIKNLGLIHLNQRLGETGKDKIRSVQEFSKIMGDNPTLVAGLLAKSAGDNADNIKVFVISDGKDEIYEEEYDAVDYRKYLYKKPFGSKGAYLLPSFKRTGDKERHTNETLRRLNECLEKNVNHSELKNLFIKFTDRITTHLNDGNKHEKGKTSFYTFKLKGKYPGEIEDIAKQFINVIYRDFKSAKGKDSLGQGVCSLCRRKEEVYGVASPLKFFTLEKEGFFPDFDCAYSWKSFPVCRDCALLLDIGESYMERHLGTYIAAHPCYIIPSFSFIEKRTDFESLDDFVDIASKRIFVKREDIENVKDYEDGIREQERVPALTYHLLFYERTNAAFNIIKHIEGIIPSRITKMFQITQEVDKRYIDNRWFPIEKSNSYKLDLTFGFLNRIFNKTKKNTIITSLDLIADIFHDRKIDKGNLFTDFSTHLQRIYLDQINKRKGKKMVVFQDRLKL